LTHKFHISKLKLLKQETENQYQKLVSENLLYYNVVVKIWR